MGVHLLVENPVARNLPSNLQMRLLKNFCKYPKTYIHSFESKVCGKKFFLWHRRYCTVWNKTAGLREVKCKNVPRGSENTQDCLLLHVALGQVFVPHEGME
jgi:hypothetical protein